MVVVERIDIWRLNIPGFVFYQWTLRVVHTHIGYSVGDHFVDWLFKMFGNINLALAM